MAMDQQRLSFRRAIVWILASVMLVSGTATAGWYYYQYVQNVRRHDPAFHLTILAQTGPEREALKSAYLAQLLDLSVEQPVNIYDFDVKQAQQRLLESPVIKEVSVRTFNPGTLYVDYTVRKPLAYVGDYSNTAVDEQGYFFPCEPFYTPKRLPEFYLGLPSTLTAADLWGQQTHSHTWHIAKAVLETASRFLDSRTTRILKVDVSKATADSYGQRQVVMSLEEVASSDATIAYMPVFLRLSATDYEQGLREYVVLRDYLWGRQDHFRQAGQPLIRLPTTIVDLRLPDLAYIEEKRP